MAHDKDEVLAILLILSVKKDIIMGRYANARHTIWGSNEINKRVACLLDCINTNKLTICNFGSKPTSRFLNSGNFNYWEEVHSKHHTNKR